MKKFKRLLLAVAFLLCVVAVSAGDDEVQYAPYYSVAKVQGTVEEVRQDVVVALELQGFEVIGEYHPGNNDNLYTICYTRQDLSDIALKFEDRGALASVLKIGLFKENGQVEISMINPMYLFYAYLLDGMENYEKSLIAISDDCIDAMATLSTELVSFGGLETKEDLQKYHYKIMMPYFTDPEELKEFNSFEEGLTTIRKNLEAKKGNTVKIYEQVYEGEKVAVFGVGLLDEGKGEGHFLPIIGERNVAAMPYEIILQGNEATMLHGKFRIALHWPELTMGTFMKIMGTPGDIEDTMELLTE